MRQVGIGTHSNGRRVWAVVRAHRYKAISRATRVCMMQNYLRLRLCSKERVFRIVSTGAVSVTCKYRNVLLLMLLLLLLVRGSVHMIVVNNGARCDRGRW